MDPTKHDFSEAQRSWLVGLRDARLAVAASGQAGYRGVLLWNAAQLSRTLRSRAECSSLAAPGVGRRGVGRRRYLVALSATVASIGNLVSIGKLVWTAASNRSERKAVGTAMCSRRFHGEPTSGLWSIVAVRARETEM
jgi:hypothetical protein